jgi:hypothetical protein
MSWSLSGKLIRPEGFADVSQNMHDLLAFDRSNAGNTQCIKERDEQIDTAQKLASVFLATEAFANAEEISVSMSGHANPEHKKSTEYANENINISVSVYKYKGETQ